MDQGELRIHPAFSGLGTAGLGVGFVALDTGWTTSRSSALPFIFKTLGQLTADPGLNPILKHEHKSVPA